MLGQACLVSSHQPSSDHHTPAHITHISMATSANLGQDTDRNSTKLVAPIPSSWVWKEQKSSQERKFSGGKKVIRTTVQLAKLAKP